MKQEKLENEEELQGYFMGRMARYVQNKGREVIGWDELTNATIPEGFIIQGWQGYGQAAMKAAELGHRFIMTPARIMYLIRYQGPQWFEPVTYFGNNTLKDVYDYEPIQRDWSQHTTSLLMGVQACMWTEFCNAPEDVDYLLFPRLSALAEVDSSTATAAKIFSKRIFILLSVLTFNKLLFQDLCARSGSAVSFRRSGSKNSDYPRNIAIFVP